MVLLVKTGYRFRGLSSKINEIEDLLIVRDFSYLLLAVLVPLKQQFFIQLDLNERSNE